MHKNSARIYVVNGKRFGTFTAAQKYKNKKASFQKRVPQKPIFRKTTEKSTTINKPIVTNLVPTQLLITTITVPKIDKFADLKALYFQVTNDYRNRHQSPPLKVSSKLEKKAEECAKKYAEKKRWSNQELNYGRNLGIVRGLLENNSVWNDRTKDFISMIWKSATDIGCALVHDRVYYICCQYFPIGNVEDEEVLRENVLNLPND
uniref:SCP domain-containing protein n=1 Tax=Strongyloides stercoralis TaxID=6248 RepID=A0AAF5DM86_STRER